jgi:hypothetical protein
MGDAVLIFRYRRPNAPGVEDASWRESTGHSGRCVVARIGIAGRRWLEIADVVICPPQPTLDEAFRRACESLKALPGSTIVAVEGDRRAIVLIRKGQEIDFCVPAEHSGRSVEDHALLYYSRLVSSLEVDVSPGSNAANRA